MKDDKKQKNKAISNFLTNEIIDENKSPIPIGYEIIKKYPLDPPFSYANILYHNEKSNYLYFVDEPRLNEEEKSIYDVLYRLIEESLESPDELKSNSNFDDHLKMVL